MTAHLYWEGVWRNDDDGRASWSEPHPWVAAGVAPLRARGVTHVLDLGCAVGRHTIFLAGEGFRTYGLDRSPTGIAIAREAARSRGVKAMFALGDVADLPYAADTFDVVLAFNVVYHTDESGLRQTVAEVRRVLRPGGLYQSTMLSKRNRGHGLGIAVSENTFCQPDAPDDKVHPHLYTDAGDLVRLHEGFDLVSATDAEQAKAGSFHWYCQFEVLKP